MELFTMNLQLFADGAGASGGASGAAADAGVTAPDAGEQLDLAQPRTSRQRERARRKTANKRENPSLDLTPAEPAPGQTAPDAAADTPEAQTAQEVPNGEGAAPGAEEKPQERPSFEALIKGEYKQDFDQRVQEIMRRRFKESEARTQRDGKINELLLTLAQMTGTEAENPADIDPDRLRTALLENESILDAAAMDAGVSTSQYKAELKMRTENAALKAQLAQTEQQKEADAQEQRTRQAFLALQQEADGLKNIYPQLDLGQLLGDQQAVRTLQALQAAGAKDPVRTVYEAIHRDEILGGLAQAAARQSMQKVANSVAANGRRPAENGAKPQGGILTSMDVKNLSRQQRRDIRRRVAAGERITL